MNEHPEIFPAFSPGEYLNWELRQNERHEFLNGHMFAMASTDDCHGTVTGNLYIALRQHLTGTVCRTYMVDMRLHVGAANSYLYPDVFVTCSPQDHANAKVKSEPTLVIEVLSASSAAYDRGAKFAQYRSIASLTEYALVDIDTRTVDCFRRGSDGLWVLHPFNMQAGADDLELASVGLHIRPDQLFADMLLAVEEASQDIVTASVNRIL